MARSGHRALPALRQQDADRLRARATTGRRAPAMTLPAAAGRAHRSVRGAAVTGAGKVAAAFSIALPTGARLDEAEIVRLFAARGRRLHRRLPCGRRAAGGTLWRDVTYVVNRNINYTNICTYACGFCAFSKGRHSCASRERPYDLGLDEIAGRTRKPGSAARPRSACRAASSRATRATPTSLSCDAVKSAAPAIHVHAFSPLEIRHGATTLGLSLRDYLGAAQGRGAVEPARHRGGDSGR